ncbi:hypothetical protein CYY_001573 [Polysphondylium violaceum]|uniref:Uncharacterized protein n=1 Tax=Polysphondylium violaceum TaxID=133409 RepID=A0A8J4Q976_9MYCE|nr:hypothetical protein CYY_001573 [Polysphondylium violaceum]
MIKSTDPLIPPFRFAIVEEGLYRGSYPTDKNFRFLKRLKLKTIVSLTPKPPMKSFYTFCERQNTNVKHFTVSKFKDDVTLSASQVVQLLELMIDPSQLPMYVHCLDGANVTGTIFMCLRKLQNWNLSVIFTEFTRFTRGGTIASAEAEFVETFKAEIDVQPSIPNWLWQGIRMTKHPTLKLRLLSNSSQNTPFSSNFIQDEYEIIDSANDSIDNSSNSIGNSGGGNSNGGSTSVSRKSSNATSLLPSFMAAANALSISTPSILTTINSSNISATTTTATPSPTIDSNTLNLISQSLNIDSNQYQPQQIILPQQQQQPTFVSSPSPSSLSTSTTIVQNQTLSSLSNSQLITQSPRVITQSGGGKEKDKEKDKKKKVDEIKLLFDSGKFLVQKESRFLEALSLERSSSPASPSSSSPSLPQNVATPTTTTTTSLQQSPLVMSSTELFNKK